VLAERRPDVVARSAGPMNRLVLSIASGMFDASLAASYRRALASFGVRVETFDLEAKRRAALPGPPALAPLVARLTGHIDLPVIDHKADRALFAVVRELEPAVVMIYCNEPVRPATLLQIKVALPEVKLVNIYPDMLFNLRQNVIAALPLYDLFCTHTKAGVGPLGLLGCRHPFYLPLAADPELHHPIELTAAQARELSCDVVYVGNWRPDREVSLARLEGLDLAIFGGRDWGNAKGWVGSRWRGRMMSSGVEFSSAHAAAKVGINPIDMLNFPGHNMRTFEIPACRAFGVVTRTPEIEELFREGEESVCFATPDELREKVEHYLSRPDERRRIAEASYQRVVHGGHTYRDRVRTLFEALGLSALLHG
jgi:spore maturation protein CgeB